MSETEKKEKKVTKKTAAKAEESPKKAAPKKKAEAKEAKPAAKKAKKGAVIADSSLYDVIVRPVVTEKSTMALEHNKVQFKVQATATKPRIKQAVEEIFGVTVTGVNTSVTKGKVKRFRGRIGKRNDVKKAIVTLKEGDSIDFAAGVK